jgi:hypothetical protein
MNHINATYSSAYLSTPFLRNRFRIPKLSNFPKKISDI